MNFVHLDGIEARRLAHAGSTKSGVELARRAAQTADETDNFDVRSHAWYAFAETLILADELEEAGRAAARSIEIRTAALRARMPSTTGITRSSSSRSGTGAAPGRVDSPPTSSTSAPSNASRRPWFTAASRSRNAPPSENESGVTLTTPMMRNTP